MSQLEQYYSLAESISRVLHPMGEVVIHDLKQNKIVAIFNGFSKREVGDPSLIQCPEAFETGPDIHGPFINQNFYGFCTKYTTTVLRDKKGKAIGLMCTNINLEPFHHLRGAMDLFMKEQSDSGELDALFKDDWQERIRSFVQEFQKEKNRSSSNLSKSERIELVAALHRAGAFKVKKAPGFTAKVLGVSRATIYNYLNEIGISDAH